MHENLEEHMFMEKVSDLFKKAVEAVTGFYFRPDVQEAIETIKQKAADVVAWIRRQVREQPEAAMVGAIAAWVTLTTISTFTLGFMLTVLFTCAVAAGAHYYFTSQHGEVAKAPKS